MTKTKPETWGNLTRAIERARFGPRALICHPDLADQVRAATMTRDTVAGPFTVHTSDHVDPGFCLIIDHWRGLTITVEPDPCETTGMWGCCRLPRGHGGEPRTCVLPGMPDEFED